MAGDIPKTTPALVIKKIGQLSSGTLLAAIINVLSFIFITQLYSPSEYGTYGIFLYFSGIFAASAPLSFQLIIPSVRDNGELNQVVISSVANVVLVSAAALPLSLAYFLFMQKAGLQNVVFVLLNIWLFGLYTILNALLINEGKNYLSGLMVALNAFLLLLLQASFSFLNMGWYGLVFGYLLALTLTNISIVLLGLQSLDFIQLLKKYSFTSHAHILKKYKNVWMFNVLQSLVNSISIWFLSFAIQLQGGKEAVGLFALCQKVLIVPVRIMGASTKQIFLRELSFMKGAQQIKIITKFSVGLIGLSLVGVGLMYFIAPLISWVLPKEWDAASIFIFPLSIWLFMTIAYTPVISLLNNLHLTKYHLGYEVLNLFNRALILGVFSVIGVYSAIRYIYVTSLMSAFCIVTFIIIALFVCKNEVRKNESS